MFTWTAADQRRARAYTTRLLEMVDEGMIDKDNLIQDLLGWMSEDDVKDFARRNDYIQDEPEDEDTDEDSEDALDDFNYVGSRHHY